MPVKVLCFHIKREAVCENFVERVNGKFGIHVEETCRWLSDRVRLCQFTSPGKYFAHTDGAAAPSVC